jgi:hemolysin activation/secretion protein
MPGRVLLLLLTLCWLSDAALAESVIPPGQQELQPQRGGGASPPLPPFEPKSPPQSTVGGQTPGPPPAQQALSTTPVFVLRAIKLEGNTVLDQVSIDNIVGPYLGKPASIASLDEIRRALTVLYINRGYINSGVTIPDQNVQNGVITFRTVEGRVTKIDISGTKYFRPDYFGSRLERALSTPFNVSDLQQEQQILLQDPLVHRLNIQLLPGLVPGEATAHADVLEGNPFSLTAQIADNQSPTVGEVRGQLQGSVANILGVGDVLSAQYGRSDGINDGAIGYSLPLSSDDTRLTIRYDINGTVVVAPSLSSLNITSQYDSVAVGLSRPFYRTAEQSLTLGSGVEWRQAQTFLLGSPFSFTAGSDNGKTNVTALRFYQEWLDRNAEHALALRSTFSVGLDIFDATVTDMKPSGKFFAWLGQAQYARRVYKDWETVLRSDLQLSNDPLFPIEQFALGGIDTVRGYRQYLTVTDDAFFASAELRVPITKIRIPRLADRDEAGRLQIVPFYDYGRGWNVGRPTPFPPDVAGVGAGLRWEVGSGLLAEVYYARPLRDVHAGTSLEDRGIYFRLTTKFF